MSNICLVYKDKHGSQNLIKIVFMRFVNKYVDKFEND